MHETLHQTGSTILMLFILQIYSSCGYRFPLKLCFFIESLLFEVICLFDIILYWNKIIDLYVVIWGLVSSICNVRSHVVISPVLIFKLDFIIWTKLWWHLWVSNVLIHHRPLHFFNKTMIEFWVFFVCSIGSIHFTCIGLLWHILV